MMVYDEDLDDDFDDWDRDDSSSVLFTEWGESDGYEPRRSFRCSQKLWDAVKAVAAERDETVSQVLRRSLIAYVIDNKE